MLVHTRLEWQKIVQGGHVSTHQNRVAEKKYRVDMLVRTRLEWQKKYRVDMLVHTGLEWQKKV